MAKIENQYDPDYAVAPGWVLADMLEARGLSHAEFARRCGRSGKLISEIIAGKAPVEPETAIRFERVLGMDASIWIRIEANSKLYHAKRAEHDKFEQDIEWASQFPVKALVDLGLINKPVDGVDSVRQLLSFFGVGSVESWKQGFDRLSLSFRRSPTFRSSEKALATWLRIGEIIAEEQECESYNQTKFRRALKDIRGLTTLDVKIFLPQMRKLCNDAGVAFVTFPELPKVALSGVARWLSPRKALIQQSLRHKSNDHFWFTFFHEAAHILVHYKRSIFIDEKRLDDDRLEREANEWAENTLISTRAFNEFVKSGEITAQSIIDFSSEQGIAPGIVVGMLQHAGEIGWHQYNNLKERYVWNV